MAVWIEWADAQGSLQRLALTDRLYIGRVCLGVPDDKRIVLADGDVSRDHAVVSVVGNQIWVRDTSRNGIRVNDIRITSGIDHPLRVGDRLAVGGHVLTLCSDEPADAGSGQDSLAETRVVSFHQHVTHLVADVRGFSTVTQRADADLVYGTLRELFDCMGSVVHQFHGTVKDLAGDAIYAFWEHGSQERAECAVQAVRAAQAQAAAVSRVLSALPDAYADLRQLKVGWGIATGSVTLGHYGVRSDALAVVGDSTNLAFRLSGLANKTLPAPIVLCQRTAMLVRNTLALTPLGEVETKGRSGSEPVFGLEAA